jgi:hypothetical protein
VCGDPGFRRDRRSRLKAGTRLQRSRFCGVSPLGADALARGIDALAHASPATLDYMRKLFAAENGG